MVDNKLTDAAAPAITTMLTSASSLKHLSAHHDGFTSAVLNMVAAAVKDHSTLENIRYRVIIDMLI